MDIQVRSRQGARDFRSDVPWAAISITSNPHVWPELSDENRVGLLQLYFKDVTIPGENSITKGHVQQILDFVKTHWDHVECILVHCDAGMSRSPAVAAAIAKIFIGEGEDQYYFQRYWPNYLVYKMLLEAHFGPMVQLQSERPVEFFD